MKRTTVGVLAVFLLLIVGMGAVSAFGGFGMEKDTAVEDAVDAGDYDAWRAAMIDTLTEKRFEQLVEMHQDKPEGVEEGRFMPREGPMRGPGMKGPDAECDADCREESESRHAETLAAMEAGDYDAWKASFDDAERVPPMFDSITEENFGLFVEMHDALQDGDLEKADELRDELGLEARHSRGGFFGMGR